MRANIGGDRDVQKAPVKTGREHPQFLTKIRKNEGMD